MSIIYDLLIEILARLKDIQQRTARTETRLCKLAECLGVRIGGDKHES